VCVCVCAFINYIYFLTALVVTVGRLKEYLLFVMKKLQIYLQTLNPVKQCDSLTAVLSCLEAVALVHIVIWCSGSCAIEACLSG